MTGGRRVDLMYLACNRLEFTRATFATLLANTDWQDVRELFVYDDGSIDGTREWLERNVNRAPVPARFVKTDFASPIAAMVHFIESAGAPLLAKIDNDVMLPPGWLRECVLVFEQHPDLSLLGIESLNPSIDRHSGPRTYVPAKFVSGLGVYRRTAFERSRPRPIDKWFGFEQWQQEQGIGLVRGWMTPSLPIFLLDRVPLDPWDRYTDRYVQRQWQRQWPKYEADCNLWHWYQSNPIVVQAGDSPRFLCALRIKNEAEYIEEVLTESLRLCDVAYVFDDHSTDQTREICRSFGDRVRLFQSPFDGLDEARDKNYLLKHILQADPEWVLWIDGDEVLEKSGSEKLRTAAQNGHGVASYHLRIAYLWGDRNHVRVDGIFGKFARQSFFRVRGQRVDRLCFQPSGNGGNFHCGNVPHGLVGRSAHLDVRLMHYGYMTQEQRRSKYKWYNTVDPDNSAEDYYRHLAGIPGAHFAPGPPKIVSWIE